MLSAIECQKEHSAVIFYYASKVKMEKTTVIKNNFKSCMTFHTLGIERDEWLVMIQCALEEFTHS
jgi:hypothetical protein